MENDRSKKLWELPEWKVTRDRLLKDHCEQCNRINTIFVLIHLKSIPKARMIGINIRNNLIAELMTQNKIKAFELNSDEISKFSRNACPECNSLTLRERKTKRPKFKCNNCLVETDNPQNVIDYTNYELRNLKNSYYSEILKKYKDEIDVRYELKINRIREWYLSGEDTVTYCKSCAFQHRKGRILCQNCNEHYHTKNYEMCFYCASIACEECGDNRILKMLNVKVCDDCADRDLVRERSNFTICKICHKNKIEFGSTANKAICDRCVLDGHWID